MCQRALRGTGQSASGAALDGTGFIIRTLRTLGAFWNLSRCQSRSLQALGHVKANVTVDVWVAHMVVCREMSGKVRFLSSLLHCVWESNFA